MPLCTSEISCCRPSRFANKSPLLPSSAYVLPISKPRSAAYLQMTLAWFSVEYRWCSVDIRTYCAAGSSGCSGAVPGRSRTNSLTAIFSSELFGQFIQGGLQNDSKRRQSFAAGTPSVSGGLLSDDRRGTPLRTRRLRQGDQ